jgi:hypothetical protein
MRSLGRMASARCADGFSSEQGGGQVGGRGASDKRAPAIHQRILSTFYTPITFILSFRAKRANPAIGGVSEWSRGIP